MEKIKKEIRRAYNDLAWEDMTHAQEDVSIARNVGVSVEVVKQVIAEFGFRKKPDMAERRKRLEKRILTVESELPAEIARILHGKFEIANNRIEARAHVPRPELHADAVEHYTCYAEDGQEIWFTSHVTGVPKQDYNGDLGLYLHDD